MSLTKVIAGMTDDSVFAANKNVIINGNLDIWQRGTSFTDPGNSDYTADRFKSTSNGAGVFDILQSTTVPDGTSDFSLQVDVTTIDSSIAAADLYTVRYIVEGYDVMRFGLGTSDATNITLSFWVRSAKTGIHCVAFRNDGVDRSYIIEYTINSANAWEFQTMTLLGDTSGTWLTDNGRGLILDWTLAAGSNRHGSANIWTSANNQSTSNQVNVMDSTANNFHLSRVQLEVGSVATAFERRSFAQELAMCQRYYFKTFAQATAPAQNVGIAGAARASSTGTGSGKSLVIQIPYPVTMRADPTIITYNPVVANANLRDFDAGADITVSVEGSSDDRMAMIENGATTGDNNRHGIHISSDAEL